MQHEIMFYAIVQKEGLGLDKAVEEAKSRYVKRPAQPCHPAQPRVASLRQAAHCLNSSLLTLARSCVPLQDVALQRDGTFYALRISLHM